MNIHEQAAGEILAVTKSEAARAGEAAAQKESLALKCAVTFLEQRAADGTPVDSARFASVLKMAAELCNDAFAMIERQSILGKSITSETLVSYTPESLALIGSSVVRGMISGAEAADRAIERKRANQIVPGDSGFEFSAAERMLDASEQIAIHERRLASDEIAKREAQAQHGTLAHELRLLDADYSDKAARYPAKRSKRK
jgi:hypothetical protein